MWGAGHPMAYMPRNPSSGSHRRSTMSDRFRPFRRKHDKTIEAKGMKQAEAAKLLSIGKELQRETRDRPLGVGDLRYGWTNQGEAGPQDALFSLP